jgi:transcription-repair coupling factor (superfamily II helicase)
MGENIDLLKQHVDKIDSFTSNSQNTFDTLHNLLITTNTEIKTMTTKLTEDQKSAESEMSKLLQDMANSFASVSMNFKKDYEHITKLMKDLNDQLTEKGR